MKLIPFFLTLLVASYPVKLALGSFAVPDNGVTTAKIASQAVTQSKLAPRTLQSPAPSATPAPTGGLAESGTSGTFSTSSSSLVDITNLTVSITSTGRPIFVGLQADGTTNASYVGVAASSATSAVGFVVFTDGSNNILASQTLELNGASATTLESFVPPGSVNHVFNYPAGTYTFKLRANGFSGTTTVQVAYCILIAYEQ